MNKKTFWLTIIIGMLLIPSVLVMGYPHRNEWLRRGLEYAANQSAREFFAGSIRLSHVEIDRKFILRIAHAEAKLKTKKGRAPVEIRSIESLNPITDYLFGKPVRFAFSGARAVDSPYDGIEGTAVSRLGENWSFELDAKIRSFGLEDLEWFDPENLAGSSGRLTGTLRFKNDYTEKPEFRIDRKSVV